MNMAVQAPTQSMDDPSLLDEAINAVQKHGVSKILVRVEKYFKANEDDNVLTGLFMAGIRHAVEQLYGKQGHALKVTSGQTPNGSPWVAAECCSGAYAEWHTESEFNVFQNWEGRQAG